jgi:uncharacterized iron-regulated protein
VAALVNQLLPADLILLGEQHDAPDHHQLWQAEAEEPRARRDSAAPPPQT